jgi:hypothetical protein
MFVIPGSLQVGVNQVVVKAENGGLMKFGGAKPSAWS